MTPGEQAKKIVKYVNSHDVYAAHSFVTEQLTSLTAERDKLREECDRLRWLISAEHHHPMLPELVNTDLAARMTAHVVSRGGLSKDEQGNVIVPNGAWAMMLEAASRLDRRTALSQPGQSNE